MCWQIIIWSWICKLRIIASSIEEWHKMLPLYLWCRRPTIAARHGGIGNKGTLAVLIDGKGTLIRLLPPPSCHIKSACRSFFSRFLCDTLNAYPHGLRDLIRLSVTAQSWLEHIGMQTYRAIANCGEDWCSFSCLSECVTLLRISSHNYGPLILTVTI